MSKMHFYNKFKMSTREMRPWFDNLLVCNKYTLNPMEIDQNHISLSTRQIYIEKIHQNRFWFISFQSYCLYVNILWLTQKPHLTQTNSSGGLWYIGKMTSSLINSFMESSMIVCFRNSDERRRDESWSTGTRQALGHTKCIPVRKNILILRDVALVNV